MKTYADIDIGDKRLIIREDFNVPFRKEGGEIADDTRIRAAIPTLEWALSRKGKKAAKQIVLLSHLGRPKPDEPNEACSLATVAVALEELLGEPVTFHKNWLTEPLPDARIVLCENVRFAKGETENDPLLAKKMATLGDVFVMDAFSSAHRAHASTRGIADYVEEAVAGPLLIKELQNLESVLSQPRQPLLALIGGAKVSTKFSLLDELLNKISYLIVGGGMANTLLAAKGHPVGKSLYEPELVKKAKQLLEKAGDRLPLPSDVVVTKEAFSAQATTAIKPLTDIDENDNIVDIGPNTIAHYRTLIEKAGTIVWNGPVGVFEYPPFATGTQAIAQAIANSSACSVAGGGDTLAAIKQFGLTDSIDFISTGGGAFLQWLEGKPLLGMTYL